MKLLRRYGIVPIVAKPDSPSVAQTPSIKEDEDKTNSDANWDVSDDEPDCGDKEDKERVVVEHELGITLARLEDLWEDISTQKDYIEQLEFEDGCLKLDLWDANRSLKKLEVAKVEDTENRRAHLRDAEEVLRASWPLFYDLYAVYETGLASATKLDDDARRLYDAYVGFQKEIKTLLNDTRAFQKITRDGLKSQATRVQELQHLKALANIRVQQENAARQDVLLVDLEQKKFDEFVATRSADLEGREKELRTREAEIRAREAELENRKKVLAGKQHASQSSVPELEARAAAAETQLSLLTAERDGLQDKRAHGNMRELQEEVDRLTRSVASTVKQETKLKKRSKRMEKEIPLTEKRTDVWKRLIDYDRPLFETNAAHVAYMSTKLVILQVEQDIETGKLKEAQALLDSAEDKLEKVKGEEREHEVLMAQRKGWDFKMKAEQIKLDMALSQTNDAKKKVKGCRL
ncbi:hypothetical protein BDZ89DRAFT_1158129 [Hymenopellis radicata]|nr:hypothetical protein BDZ89DRAFT_1158129 [Hymenopellis radicata]